MHISLAAESDASHQSLWSYLDSHESTFQDLLQADSAEHWNICSKLTNLNKMRIRSQILQRNSRFSDVWSCERMAMNCCCHMSPKPIAGSTFHAGSTVRFGLHQLHRTVGQELCTLLQWSSCWVLILAPIDSCLKLIQVDWEWLVWSDYNDYESL